MAKNKRKIFSVNITNKLGERMKSARESRGYTWEQLSERSGVSERYIVAIENEGSVPKIPVLNDLLRGLGLSANFIFYPEQDIDDPQLDHLIRLFYACDVRDRKVIIDVANSLIDNREPITIASKKKEPITTFVICGLSALRLCVWLFNKGDI